jgi:hypothetical protein
MENHDTGLLAYIKDVLPGSPDNSTPAALVTRIRTFVNAVLAVVAWFHLLGVHWDTKDIAIIMLLVNATISLFGGTFIRNRTVPAYAWDPKDDPSHPAFHIEHEDPEALHNGDS